MNAFRIDYTTAPISLPDGFCLGVVGEHNAVQIVIILPESAVAGVSYHTVTIGGVESAPITETEANVDEAIRIGNVIYQPLTAHYTTKPVVDISVKAIKQNGDDVELVDITPTVHGLRFAHGQPEDLPGGLVADVVALKEQVGQIEDDLPTEAEKQSWNTAAEEAHQHTNLSDVLEKLSAVGDSLYFDGNPIGGGASIPVVDTPNDLDESAENGSLSVALNGGPVIVPIDYPEQTGSETVNVDIAGIPFSVGSPVYSDSGLTSALANHALPTLAIQFAGGSSYGGELFPIVTDLSDNMFVDAGITVTADKAIVGQSDKDYAVSLSLIDSGTDAINPDKIIQVDESHISVPGVAIYVFEPVTGLVGGMLTESLEGWNIVRLTLDTSTFDVTDASLETDVEINDYLNIVPDDGNTMTLTGAGATMLFSDLICQTVDIPRGLYVRLGGAWIPYDPSSMLQIINNVQDEVDDLGQIAHTHGNKDALDGFSGTGDSLSYNGIPLIVPDDVSMLKAQTYDILHVRDDVVLDGTGIQDVPVYTGETYTICTLNGYGSDLASEYIKIEEVRDEVSNITVGLPVRVLTVKTGGTVYSYFGRDWTRADSSIVPRGWENGNQPTIAGFTPTSITVNGQTYSDLSSLPADAESTLRSLSQCINVTAADMGAISVPEDAVERFAGRIRPNRKYYFEAVDGSEIDFDLPTPEWTEDDVQFVLYLSCGQYVDLTFPAGTYFVGSAPNSDAGNHKLIGCWLRDVGKWSVGGVDYEAVTA